MLTDPKIIFDLMTKISSTSEKGLMIDILAVREAFSNHDISDVGYATSDNNPADSFKNVKNFDAFHPNLFTFKRILDSQKLGIRNSMRDL